MCNEREVRSVRTVVRELPVEPLAGEGPFRAKGVVCEYVLYAQYVLYILLT